MKDIGNKYVLILLGPPGSGKGSISELLINQGNWIQLSTGNLCRQHIAQKTDMGIQISDAIESGKLLDDSIITEMVDSWLKEQIGSGKSIILDGFPRSYVQARALNNIIQDSLSKYINIIIKFKVDDQVLIERLTSRLVCSNKECQTIYSLKSRKKDISKEYKDYSRCDKCGCLLEQRPDDKVDIIKKRLSIYRKHEQEIIRYYDSIGKEIHTVNVDRDISEIFDCILKIIKNNKK